MGKGLMLGGPFLTCNRIPSKFYFSYEWKNLSEWNLSDYECMLSCVSIHQRNLFMLWYISRPEFGLSEHSCMNNWEVYNKLYIHWECCVLSLCSLNIAKNLSLLSVVWQHFIALTGAMTIAIWNNFYSILRTFWTYSTSTRPSKTTKNHLGRAEFLPIFTRLSELLQARTGTANQNYLHNFVKGPLENTHTKCQDDRTTGGHTTANLPHPCLPWRGQISPRRAEFSLIRGLTFKPSSTKLGQSTTKTPPELHNTAS